MAHSFLSALSPSVELRRGAFLFLAIALFAFLLPILWISRLSRPVSPKDEAELIEELEALGSQPKAPKSKKQKKPQGKRQGEKPRRGPGHQARGAGASHADALSHAARPHSHSSSGSDDGLSAAEAPAWSGAEESSGHHAWLQSVPAAPPVKPWEESAGATAKQSAQGSPLAEEAGVDGSDFSENPPEWLARGGFEAEDEACSWSQVGGAQGRRKVGAQRRAAKAAKAAAVEQTAGTTAVQAQAQGGLEPCTGLAAAPPVSKAQISAELGLATPAAKSRESGLPLAAGRAPHNLNLNMLVEAAAADDVVCSQGLLASKADLVQVISEEGCSFTTADSQQLFDEKPKELNEVVCTKRGQDASLEPPHSPSHTRTLPPPPGLDLLQCPPMGPPPGLAPPPGLMLPPELEGEGALPPPPGLGWDAPPIQPLQ